MNDVSICTYDAFCHTNRTFAVICQNSFFVNFVRNGFLLYPCGKIPAPNGAGIFSLDFFHAVAGIFHRLDEDVIRDVRFDDSRLFLQVDVCLDPFQIV